MRTACLEKIQKQKVIVIVRGIYGEKVLALAEALRAGGIGLMEITFDQKDASTHDWTVQTIRMLNDRMGDEMAIGAGTVTNVELVEKACDAGAKYIISPDFKAEVVKRTRELNLISIPGALTPTEIVSAYDCGADFVKVFPAAQLGPAYIKAIRGPLNHIPLMAVGGVNEKNAADFIKAGCAGVGVGGNLVNKEIISSGRWDKITELAGMFVEAVR